MVNYTGQRLLLVLKHQFKLGYRYRGDRLDHFKKLVEKVFRIMGARTCFRMVLDRKQACLSFVFRPPYGRSNGDGLSPADYGLRFPPC